MRIITPAIVDADRLFEIELENYGSEESTEKDTFKEIIEFPEDFKGYSLKALMCDSVCGFYCTVEKVEKVELVDIAVLKSEQGKGLGSFLLAHCLSENQRKVISLIVREDNISAINLYEKFGFEKVKVINDYYDDCLGIEYSKKIQSMG